MDSWLFPFSKKVCICIFWTSITKVVTIGVTSVNKNGQNSKFSGRKPPRYLVYIIFEYEGTLYTLFLSMKYIFL